MNELIFIFHSLLVYGGSLVALRLGKVALVSYITLLAVVSNLFITKQIMLFGMEVVATDAYAVGAMVGLQMLQEYYGRAQAKRAIIISFCLLIFYGIMAAIHLNYIPSEQDTMHIHFVALLKHMPRITIASLTSYLGSQLLDYHFYGLLGKLFSGSYLLLRNLTSLLIVQLFDTILFSFLGLYGIINDIKSVIIMSFSIKMVVIFLSPPFIAVSKKLIKK